MIRFKLYVLSQNLEFANKVLEVWIQAPDWIHQLVLGGVSFGAVYAGQKVLKKMKFYSKYLGKKGARLLGTIILAVYERLSARSEGN